MRKVRLSEIASSAKVREGVEDVLRSLRTLAATEEIVLVVEAEQPVTASFLDGLLVSMVRSGLFSRVILAPQGEHHVQKVHRLAKHSTVYTADADASGVHVLPRA